MNKALVTTLVTALVLAVQPVSADFSKADRKEAKKSLVGSGTMYLRVDAPCATGRHAYGTYTKPLVEVSPEGINTDTDTAVNASWFHADTTYWGIRINDPVVIEDLDFDGTDVEVELQGVGPVAEESTVIKLMSIGTLDDLRAALDKVLSPAPLQDAHDDWSDEVKEAIGKRELVNGMSKRQAFYVTGQPMSFEKKDEDGKEVEIWKLRLDKGVKLGFFTAKADQVVGLPESIRFEDGVLVGVGSSGAGSSSSFSVD